MQMEVETGGRPLSSALMTFGKQWAPSALEETGSICYRAQASNLILDRRNEIDIIYPTPNSLICYGNPQRTFSISNIPIHPSIVCSEQMSQKEKKAGRGRNLSAVIKLMLRHSLESFSVLHIVFECQCVCLRSPLLGEVVERGGGAALLEIDVFLGAAVCDRE